MANSLTSNGIVTNGSSGCYQSSWSLPNIYCAIFRSSGATLPSGGSYVYVRNSRLSQGSTISGGGEVVVNYASGGASTGGYHPFAWRVS